MKVIQLTIIFCKIEILKSSWEVFIGQLVRIRGRTHPIYTATFADEGGAQGALFMCYI